MKSLRRHPLFLPLLAAALVGVVGGFVLLRLRPAAPASTKKTVAVPALAHAVSPAARSIARTAADRRNPAWAEVCRGQSRAEIARLLTTYFRREQVEAELALEQTRYGRGHWQTELGGKHLLALEQTRVALVTRLQAEANELLDEMSGGDTGPALALTPLFGPERAGPNVAFLSAASRARLADLIAERAAGGGVDAAGLLTDARSFLPPDELAQYARWNAPEAALLRKQLVGFDAREEEFAAIARWSNFVNQGNSATADDRRAELALADQIGVARLAELFHLRDPEMQTAVHDLHRLGLPLDRAEWLAACRAQGARELSALWSDPILPSAAKEEQVRELQQAYRARIAATLALSSTIDPADLMP